MLLTCEDKQRFKRSLRKVRPSFVLFSLAESQTEAAAVCPFNIFPTLASASNMASAKFRKETIRLGPTSCESKRIFSD
jgi:hypothetical protein